eukprot:PhM_4_TR15657/c0_g1_i1/m.61285
MFRHHVILRYCGSSSALARSRAPQPSQITNTCCNETQRLQTGLHHLVCPQTVSKFDSSNSLVLLLPLMPEEYTSCQCNDTISSILNECQHGAFPWWIVAADAPQPPPRSSTITATPCTTITPQYLRRLIDQQLTMYHCQRYHVTSATPTIGAAVLSPQLKPILTVPIELLASLPFLQTTLRLIQNAWRDNEAVVRYDLEQTLSALNRTPPMRSPTNNFGVEINSVQFPSMAFRYPEHTRKFFTDFATDIVTSWKQEHHQQNRSSAAQLLFVAEGTALRLPHPPSNKHHTNSNKNRTNTLTSTEEEKPAETTSDAESSTVVSDQQMSAVRMLADDLISQPLCRGEGESEGNYIRRVCHTTCTTIEAISHLSMDDSNQTSIATAHKLFNDHVASKFQTDEVQTFSLDVVSTVCSAFLRLNNNDHHNYDVIIERLASSIMDQTSSICNGDGTLGATADLDTYSAAVRSLLDLFEHTGRVAFLDRAAEIQQQQDNQFLRCGQYCTFPQKDTLLRDITRFPVFDGRDAASPCGSPVARSMFNLLRLGYLVPTLRQHTHRKANECASRYMYHLKREVQKEKEGRDDGFFDIRRAVHACSTEWLHVFEHHEVDAQMSHCLPLMRSSFMLPSSLWGARFVRVPVRRVASSVDDYDGSVLPLASHMGVRAVRDEGVSVAVYRGTNFVASGDRLEDVIRLESPIN